MIIFLIYFIGVILSQIFFKIWRNKHDLNSWSDVIIFIFLLPLFSYAALFSILFILIAEYVANKMDNFDPPSWL